MTYQSGGPSYSPGGEGGSEQSQQGYGSYPQQGQAGYGQYGSGQQGYAQQGQQAAQGYGQQGYGQQGYGQQQAAQGYGQQAAQQQGYDQQAAQQGYGQQYGGYPQQGYGQQGYGQQGYGQQGYGQPAPAAKPPRQGLPAEIVTYLTYAVGALGLINLLLGFVAAWKFDSSVGGGDSTLSVFNTSSSATLVALAAAGLIALTTLLPKVTASTYSPIVAGLTVTGLLVTAFQIATVPDSYSAGIGLILILVFALIQTAVAVTWLLVDGGILKTAPAASATAAPTTDATPAATAAAYPSTTDAAAAQSQSAAYGYGQATQQADATAYGQGYGSSASYGSAESYQQQAGYQQSAYQTPATPTPAAATPSTPTPAAATPSTPTPAAPSASAESAGASGLPTAGEQSSAPSAYRDATTAFPSHEKKSGQ